jgi:hypothetical protein
MEIRELDCEVLARLVLPCMTTVPECMELPVGARFF